MRAIKKVVVIGPESTGKSTLCQQLAERYNAGWCAEYAREYLLEHGTDYTFDSLLDIAKGQLQLEDKAVAELQDRLSSDDTRAPFLFIDTNMYVMQVWCEFVFGKTHPFITEQIKTRKYDLYLLCNTDLPWVKDELREYPDLETRETLYQLYKNIVQNQPVPWVDVHGNYAQRKLIAIEAVNELVNF